MHLLSKYICGERAFLWLVVTVPSVIKSAADVEVHYGEKRIATHNKTPREHLTVTQPEHHHGIPTGARAERKILIHIQDMAPIVEVRSLAAYDNAFGGDCQ